MLMVAKRTRPVRDAAVRARRLRTAPPPSVERDQAVIGQAQLARIQRARILAAMVDVACKRGAANVSVADVTSRCGVSRRTFYELFSDREDCFAAAFEDALALAAARVLPAYEAERKWVERLRAGITAFMYFLDEQPKLGQLLVCESLTGGRRVLDRRMRVTEQLAVFVNEGRRESKLGEGTPLLHAEGAVGGVLSILQKLLAYEHEPPIELAGVFTSMLVMAYLGPAAAQRERDRPIEAAPVRRDGAALSDPFKHAGMRLTYRTVSVLSLVAENPGSSNRTLGELAGVRDQGQVSKLLARLKRLGLIDNGDAERSQGAPNAWVLTDAGSRLADSIRRHTSAQTHESDAP
jgi:AcrR family transcriptional regulator/DNA-binding MarR family transcriptional regulator